jgi:hypothetical protein
MLEFILRVFRHAIAQFGDMEYYTLVLIGLMITVWIVGSVVNNRVAKKVFDQGIAPALVDEFAAPATSLFKESNSHYLAYSSGRGGCSGMSCSLHLSPRQDFISRFGVGWFWPSWYPSDRVVIEVAGAEIDPAVSALICRKFKAKELTEKFPEMKKLAKPFNGALGDGMFAKHSSSSLTGFTYICDAGGRAIGPNVFGKSSLLSSQVPPTILDDIKYILVSGSTKQVTVEFEKIPSNWENAVSFILRGILDPLTEIKVSDSVRAEVMAAREADAIREREAAEREAREEATNKRNAEKKKEREEMLKRMSPEQARKFEEKEQKKQLKKKMASGRMYL